MLKTQYLISELALEQAIAAPLCTRHLADLGARVIKIEQPGSGDATRHYDHAVRGLAAHFVWLNHGKESAALDLAAAADLDVFTGLLERADVLVSNLAPGALARSSTLTNPPSAWTGLSAWSGSVGPCLSCSNAAVCGLVMIRYRRPI